MALKLITPPTEEPITLAEAKAHLRVDFTDEDSIISSLITVARSHVEMLTQRALVTQSWRYTLDSFPETMPILIPLPPLQAVTIFTYVDQNGVTRSLIEGTDFLVDKDSEPGRITPAPGKEWPDIQQRMNAVTIEFTAGYGTAANVLKPFKQAMLLLMGHWFENREAVVKGQFNELPLAVDSLLFPYRVWRFQ